MTTVTRGVFLYMVIALAKFNFTGLRHARTIWLSRLSTLDEPVQPPYIDRLSDGVSKMINTKTLAIVGLAMIGFTGVANAESWYEPEPMIWKTVRAGSGEDAWQACRRHFRNDVARVKWSSSGRVSCYVPYHYIYGPGELRQNFNQ